MDEYRDKNSDSKREGSTDKFVKDESDEFSALGGKTRLVSPKPTSPTSPSRGSRSPVSSTATFLNTPPQTPTVPQVSPPTSPSYQTEAARSFIVPSSTFDYRQVSPNTNSLYSSPQQLSLNQYHGPSMQNNNTLQPQSFQHVPQVQHQMQWPSQDLEALNMSYEPTSMQFTDQPMVVEPGQYNTYSSTLSEEYTSPQGFIPSPTDGTGVVDMDAHWRSWMAQFYPN